MKLFSCHSHLSIVEVDTQSRPFSMPSFELKALIPREYMLYKVSKTPTIIFRLDTTPECCTRVTPHFLRNTLKHTKAASRSARRANHTTRRTSACRSRSVRADRAQKHALATTSKRTVAAAVHVAVHEVDPQRHHEICPPKKGWPLRPHGCGARSCACCAHAALDAGSRLCVHIERARRQSGLALCRVEA